MSKVPLADTLRREYENLFNSCAIRAERVRDVERTVSALLQDQDRYARVGVELGVPWCVVAVIHCMEASRDFTRHLHNGDPLRARTVHVPAGRPRTGNPPFSWEESAQDALTLRGMTAKTDWSLAGTLHQIEGYNGWGYRLYHPHVLSPYLWCFSGHYTSGKYVGDGTWSDTAVSKQCGAAVLLRRLAEMEQIEFADQPAPAPAAVPLIVRYSAKRPRDPESVASAERLQRWLNTFPGIFVKVDGVPGPRTSEAYRKVTGSYLPGDPRIR